MKNLIIISVLILTSLFNAKADNYEEVMETNIQKLNMSQNVDELINVANTFDRIAQKESDKWLPFYYSAYANVYVLFINREATAKEKNVILDKAQEKLNKAIELKETESENHVLQGFIYQMRITDPSLGYKFSTLSNECFERALILNPNNPRAHYLKGSNVFYTPAEYGGGKEVAKPLFQKAAKLFELKSDGKLLPNWGSEHNTIMLKQCN